MISYRVGPAVIDKNDGNENQNLTNYPAKVDKDSDDGEHKGATTGTIEYFDGEFHVRLEVGGRDWHFRALTVETLRENVFRFFSADRGRIKLKLSRAADLARYGEHAAIGRL
jgi:hypothetical protein